MKISFKQIIIILLVLFLGYKAYYNYLRPVTPNPYVDKNNLAYTNDLYMTDNLLYNSLNSKEKLLYNRFIEINNNFKSSASIDLTEFGCIDFISCEISVEDVWHYITIDHPELIQIGSLSYFEYYANSPKVDVRFTRSINTRIMTYLGERHLKRIIEDIKIATKDMTEKEKVNYVYEWIGDNANYDTVFTKLSKNQSAYSAMVKGSGVCAAYAKSSQIIFQNIGIKSYITTGRTSGPHMWNIVEVDGKNYWYDATVASSEKKDSPYHYDGLKQSEFSSYVLNYNEVYPKTSPEEYLIN